MENIKSKINFSKKVNKLLPNMDNVVNRALRHHLSNVMYNDLDTFYVDNQVKGFLEYAKYKN